VVAIWQQLAMSDTIADQFISHYYSRLGSTSFYHTLKKALGGNAITSILQIDIDYLTVLVNGTP
jgi:hypothetical protein